MTPPSFVKIINGIWCLANDNAITLEIEKSGKLAWDQTFLKIIAHLQRRQPGLVLDIGAYIGDSTEWFTSHGFPTVAFECQRDAFLCLNHNCQQSSNICFPVGNGETVRLSGGFGNMAARHVSPGENGIPTLRLDDFKFNSRIACLKIDVAGWEPNVLAGARQTIAEHQPIIVLQINPQALAGRGFCENDIFRCFEGWQQEEIYRYYDANWDIMFTPGVSG